MILAVLWRLRGPLLVAAALALAALWHFGEVREARHAGFKAAEQAARAAEHEAVILETERQRRAAAAVAEAARLRAEARAARAIAMGERLDAFIAEVEQDPARCRLSADDARRVRDIWDIEEGADRRRDPAAGAHG